MYPVQNKLKQFINTQEGYHTDLSKKKQLQLMEKQVSKKAYNITSKNPKKRINDKKGQQASTKIIKSPTTTPEWWKKELAKRNVTSNCINDLPDNKKRWLQSFGLSPQLEAETANAWLSWKKKVQQAEKKRKIDYSTTLHNNQIKWNIKFHEFIANFRNGSFDSERDNWGDWLKDCPLMWKGFITTLVMILTPRSKDSSIKDMVATLREICNVTNPQSIIFFQGKSYENRTELQNSLSSYTNTNYDYKKASYCVELAMVCLVEGKFPSSEHELLSLLGVGYKVAHVVLWEEYKHAIGIPCDIHMCRIFNALGWVTTKNVSKEKITYNMSLTSKQMESWLPQRMWGDANRIYAGLGQLINDRENKKFVSSNLIKEAKKKGSKYVKHVTMILKEYNITI